MHSHDHDLIAALAEGILAESLSTSAEAEIAACPECAAELAGQRLALHALGDLAPAALTAEESSGLRSSVAEALSLPTVPAAMPPPKPARRAPWLALGFATTLAAVVMAVPVIGMIVAGGDDDASGTTTAAAFSDEEAREGLDTLGATQSDGSAAIEESALAPTEDLSASTTQEPVGAGVVTTTIAASQSTTAAETGEAPSNEVKGEDGLRGLFEAGPDNEALTYDDQTPRSSLECIAAAEEALGEESRYLDVHATLDDDRIVVVYVDAGWTMLAAFDPEDCSVALTLP